MDGGGGGVRNSMKGMAGGGERAESETNGEEAQG